MNNNTKERAIKSKLINLLSVTSKDMCIRTKMNLKGLDLLNFFNHEEIQKFLEFKTNQLILNANKGQEFLKNELEQFEDSKTFLNYLSEKEITISNVLRDKIQKKFNQVKELAINQIITKSDNQKRKIDQIIKNAKSIVENTGVHSLYIGKLFLVGYTIKGTPINAPLILYPLDTITTKENTLLEHASNSFVVNEKLLNFLKKEYEVNFNITNLVQEIKQTNNLNLLLEQINNVLNTSLSFNDEENIINLFNANEPHFNEGNFKINYNYVLGIFEPTGGALKYDLEKLVMMDKLEDPFINKNNISKTKFINDEIENKPLVSINGKLNIYQKYAIRSALAQNTLIFGPPGTGKSEVITNIIANALMNRKSTLVVAEKKVALDILIERLQHLSDFTLFIIDLKNKKQFYEKIAWVADQLENMYFDNNDIDNSAANLLQMLSSNTKEFFALKNYFENVEDLLKLQDSNRTTFLDFLKWSDEIDYELLNFVKNNDSLNFINRTMVRHSFTDFVTFKNKMCEYIDFITNTKLNNLNIDKVLKEQKHHLINFQSNYNTLNFLQHHSDQINSLEKELLTFLQNTRLIDNKKFMNILNKSPYLLSEQKNKLDYLLNTFPQIINPTTLKYLIKNSSKFTSFLNKYDSQSEANKETYLFNFLTKTGLFKKSGDQVEFKEHGKNVYISLLKIFNSIPLNDQAYLTELTKYENSTIFDQNIVLIHFNQWLKNSYIINLGTKNLSFFSSCEVSQFKPITKMTEDDYKKIGYIITFENQIIANTKSLNINIQNLLTAYLLENEKNNKNMSELLANYYLQSLKKILLNLDQNTKSRIQELFAIAKREVRNNPPIKQLINNYYKELMILFPIWISLPELVAQLLPLKKNIFNYGIFDEASQIFMERSYPIVYRCETNIVAGDDKQLKPTSFFANRDERNYNDFELTDNDQVESLLDRAKVALWPSYHLRNHYRSVHRDLIQFSNDFIYDKNLHFVSQNDAPYNTVEVINVDGVANEGANEIEANKVFELIGENINNYPKIIVVTFGTKQSSYIEQIIQKNSIIHPEIYEKYMNGEIIVSNLENVQGNEGDLVILSVTYGKDNLGNFKGSFGPLLVEGGTNRLNVAITRARGKMFVVKSFTANEMRFNQDNINAVVLREFINYCDNLDLNLKHHNIIKINENNHSLIHNDVQNILNKYIADKHEYKLVKNYDIGSITLDFAIIDNKSNKTCFAIMINKLSNLSNVASLFENIDNYIFIKNRGYEPHMIDEHYWIKNPLLAEKSIIEKLKSLNI